MIQHKTDYLKSEINDSVLRAHSFFEDSFHILKTIQAHFRNKYTFSILFITLPQTYSYLLNEETPLFAHIYNLYVFVKDFNIVKVNLS